MTLKEICDELPISTLKNIDENTFWYIRNGENKFSARYKHENGKTGDVFYDGNNGDRWIVRAVNLKYNRMIVENKSQGGMLFVLWE